MTVSPRTRRTVFARDPECIVEGVTAAFGKCQSFRSLQHLTSRGMGSSNLFDTPEHLVSMCCYHNVLLTSDAAFARLGRRYGWVRSRNSVVDPVTVPVLYRDGWWLLVGDGRLAVSTPEALDIMDSLGIEAF